MARYSKYIEQNTQLNFVVVMTKLLMKGKPKETKQFLSILYREKTREIIIDVSFYNESFITICEPF